jgi:serine/threonine protein kinase
MDLLDKMLKIDPKERITASEMQAHPYLTSFLASDM